MSRRAGDLGLQDLRVPARLTPAAANLRIAASSPDRLAHAPLQCARFADRAVSLRCLVFAAGGATLVPRARQSRRQRKESSRKVRTPKGKGGE